MSKEIVCSGGEIAICDDEDYPLLSRFRWVVRGGYPMCRIVGSGLVAMYRIVFGDRQKGNHIDHINRDKLDSRKCNLRSVSPSVNGANKARPLGKNPYTGVYLVSGSKDRWYFQVTKEGRYYKIGYLSDPAFAAELRDCLKKYLFGDATTLIFPDRDDLLPMSVEDICGKYGLIDCSFSVNADPVKRSQIALKCKLKTSGRTEFGVRMNRKYRSGEITWTARININRRVVGVGPFDSKDDARRAYDRLAMYYKGDYAVTNFPDSGPPASVDQIREEIANKKRIKKGRTRGVCPVGGKFKAVIHPRKDLFNTDNDLYLGLFDTQQDAALAHDAVARFFGLGNHCLNFPDIETIAAHPCVFNDKYN